MIRSIRFRKKGGGKNIDLPLIVPVNRTVKKAELEPGGQPVSSMPEAIHPRAHGHLRSCPSVVEAKERVGDWECGHESWARARSAGHVSVGRMLTGPRK